MGPNASVSLNYGDSINKQPKKQLRENKTDKKSSPKGKKNATPDTIQNNGGNNDNNNNNNNIITTRPFLFDLNKKHYQHLSPIDPVHPKLLNAIAASPSLSRSYLNDIVFRRSGLFFIDKSTDDSNNNNNNNNNNNKNKSNKNNNNEEVEVESEGNEEKEREAEIPLPILQGVVRGTVVNLMSEVEVIQDYYNYCDHPINARYIFPIARLSAVCIHIFIYIYSSISSR